MRHVFVLSPLSRKLVTSVAWLLACTGGAHAALQGRDVDGVAANGYEAFYDTVLNITWLADANYAKTSGFDATGAMSWDRATDWVAALSFLGVGGWRLPHFEPLNGVSIVSYARVPEDYYNGHIDLGYNNTSSRNELSYMYYVNLHLQGSISPEGVFQSGVGVDPSGVQSVPDVAGGHIVNLQSNMYWTNVRDPDEFQKYWGLWMKSFATGSNGRDYGYNKHDAWAVHDGDPFKVSIPIAVPNAAPAVDEPASAWLMLAGLGMSTFLMRRRSGIKNRALALV